jgi:hypothetical protein
VDVGELLTRGYRSFGFGADADVLRMFDQRIEGDTIRWVVVDYISGGRETATREVVAHDLLGSIPPHWEVAGVDTHCWRRRGDSIVVTGHIRVRPRGGWDVESLPFAHIWRVTGDKVVSVRSYLDGIEVRRPKRRQ